MELYTTACLTVRFTFIKVCCPHNHTLAWQLRFDVVNTKNEEWERKLEEIVQDVADLWPDAEVYPAACDTLCVHDGKHFIILGEQTRPEYISYNEKKKNHPSLWAQ